jgi:hypothetical protein
MLASALRMLLGPSLKNAETTKVLVFAQNALAGEWRSQVRRCKEQGIALHRHVAFALAVADLLELPDDFPLMPPVTPAMGIPTCLSDPMSLARLKEVARSAGQSESCATSFGLPT